MDYNCTDESHSSARDTVMLDTLVAVVESSYTSVPLTGSVGGVNGTKRVIPGWSQQVEPYRQASNVAYRTWIAHGKPRQGPVHKSKLATHA